MKNYKTKDGYSITVTKTESFLLTKLDTYIDFLDNL
jgi:hypothetical protein